MTRIIGLTGGIASGKSTVSNLLRQAGLPIIDADQVARQVQRPGSPALDKLAAAFGHIVIAIAGFHGHRGIPVAVSRIHCRHAAAFCLICISL